MAYLQIGLFSAYRCLSPASCSCLQPGGQKTLTLNLLPNRVPRLTHKTTRKHNHAKQHDRNPGNKEKARLDSYPAYYPVNLQIQCVIQFFLIIVEYRLCQHPADHTAFRVGGFYRLLAMPAQISLDASSSGCFFHIPGRRYYGIWTGWFRLIENNGPPAITAKPVAHIDKSTTCKANDHLIYFR